MNSNNPYKDANEFDSFAQSLERDLNINDNDTYDNGRRYNHGSDHNDIDNDNTDIIANTNVYNNVNELNQQRHQWHLKPLTTDDGNRVKIITQNENGPCSLIALVNILILRNEIQISPPSRTSVDYDYVSSLIADYLLSKPLKNNVSDDSLSNALSVLPHLRYGLDLNPHFHSPFALSPSSKLPLLDIFNISDVQIVHGWVYDRHSKDSDIILQHGQNYDHATQIIAEGDSLDAILPNSSSSSNNFELNEHDQNVVKNARILANFINNSRTQMTITGLFALSDTLPDRNYVALFRNSHLSVLYKRNNKLYSLVSDGALAEESDIIWETLEDVDGSGSSFLNSEFRPSGTIGGDYAGLQSAYVDETLTDEQKINIRAQKEGWDDETYANELARVQNTARNDEDLALAMQLQQEENSRRRNRNRNDGNTNTISNSNRIQPQVTQQPTIKRKNTQKKSCNIM